MRRKEMGVVALPAHDTRARDVAAYKRCYSFHAPYRDTREGRRGPVSAIAPIIMQERTSWLPSAETSDGSVQDSGCPVFDWA